MYLSLNSKIITQLKYNIWLHEFKTQFVYTREENFAKTLIITVVGTKLETKYYFFLYLKLYFGPNFGGTCV